MELQWFKIKWNAVQCKARGGRVIHGKESFRFYILMAKNLTKYWSVNLFVIVKGEERRGGGISTVKLFLKIWKLFVNGSLNGKYKLWKNK